MSSPPRFVTFTDRKLQMKFKHASVFGIDGSYTPENAEKFKDAIRAYIADATVEQIVGTFRGDPVIHYYHKERKINAMTEPDGTFISVWGLNSQQIVNLEERGSL